MATKINVPVCIFAGVQIEIRAKTAEFGQVCRLGSLGVKPVATSTPYKPAKRQRLDFTCLDDTDEDINQSAKDHSDFTYDPSVSDMDIPLEDE